MQIPILLDHSSRTSLTDQIVEQVRHAIAHARIPRGTRLPSSRRLSEQLAIARNTVIRAYEALMVDGLVEARPASGMFVAHDRPASPLEPSPAAIEANGQPPSWCMPLPALPVRTLHRASSARSRLSFDFCPGRAHPALFPLKIWRRVLQKNLSHGSAAGLTDHGEAAGLPALRSAIAVHLATTRGIAADPSRIIIISGVQEGISLASRMFLHRGTLAALEDPCAQGAAFAFESTGSEIAGVAVDEDGLVPDDLPQRPTALLYVTPSHHYPTGRVLSLARRDSLAAWARRCGCYVIEDDSDGEFRYEGSSVPAIASLAPDCTIYLGTFSRTLGAGLRLGFMVVPPRLTDAMISAKDVLNQGNPWLEQAALAELMQGTTYATHVSRVRAHYRENRDCLLGALCRNFGEVSVSGEGGGLHLLWHLPAGVPDSDVVEDLARRARIGIYALKSGGAFTIRRSMLDRRAILLGFGALLPKQIDQGIDRLSEAIDDAVDDPRRDVTEFLVRVPQASIGVHRRANRAPSHLDSRFRRQPALPKPPRPHAPSEKKTAQGNTSVMPTVTSIYRYPVKGLSAQPLSRVEAVAGMPLKHDRVFALARPTAPIDPDDPKWAKKGLFAMLMLDEGLANVTTDVDVDTLWLTATRGNQQVAAGCLASKEDREALERFFWTLLPSFKTPPVLVRSRGGHFMDKPDNVVSLINLATLRSLEERWGVRLDPLRFRANIYIDGARAWEECDWVGHEIRIGSTIFLVDRLNGRCGATNVDPANGRRDLDVPGSLRAAFGHKNLGIYLVARKTGVFAIGDQVAVPGAAEDVPANRSKPVHQTGTRRQFICRGCYYLYDDNVGIPQQGIAPGTPFETIPSDWLCPDCGSGKVLFTPHLDPSSSRPV